MWMNNKTSCYNQKNKFKPFKKNYYVKRNDL